MSLLLLTIILFVIFKFVFRGGDLTHREFWHIILWISVHLSV